MVLCNRVRKAPLPIQFISLIYISWAHLDQFYVNIWNEVIAHEVVKMHLEVTCTHLPPTTLPVTGFLSSPRPESN